MFSVDYAARGMIGNKFLSMFLYGFAIGRSKAETRRAASPEEGWRIELQGFPGSMFQDRNGISCAHVCGTKRPTRGRPSPLDALIGFRSTEVGGTKLGYDIGNEGETYRE